MTVAQTPPGATSDGGLPVGLPSAPVRVDVYEDVQCAACGPFETRMAPVFAALTATRLALVVYHPMTYLDVARGGSWSRRAAVAQACALPAQGMPRLHDALFAHQPKDPVGGLSTSALLTLAGQAGVTGTGFATCVVTQTYRAWVVEAEASAVSQGVNETPTVRVAGRTLDDVTPARLAAAVRAAGPKG